MTSVHTSPWNGYNPLRSLCVGLPDSPNDEQSAYAARFVDTGSTEPLPAPAKPVTTCPKEFTCRCGMTRPKDFGGLFIVSPRTGCTLVIPDYCLDHLPPRVRARIVSVGRGWCKFTTAELNGIIKAVRDTPAPVVYGNGPATFAPRWSRR